MGVCAIALLFIPDLAAPFRLVKWALWGAVLAVMAVRLAADSGLPVRFIPRNRWIFFTAMGFVVWSMIAPWVTTPFTTAHTAGMLLMAMGFAFSWLSALELQGAGNHEQWQGLFILGLGGSLLSIIVILQASGLTLPGFIPAVSREFRVLGTLGNPNWTAGFLLSLPPVLLGVRSWLSEKNESRHLQAACAIMAVLIACATVATGSKAGAIALVAGFVAYILLDTRMKGRNRQLTVIGTFLVITVAGTGLISSGLLHSLSWTRGRLFLWKTGLTLMAQNPLTGIGFGGFPAGYPRALPMLIGGDPLAYMPLHRVEFAYNDMLQFAVESGVPSALLYLALVFLLLRHVNQVGDGLTRGVGAAMAAMVVYGCFDSPLQLPGTLALWWYLVGWMMAGWPKEHTTPEKTAKLRPWMRLFFSVCLILLGLFQTVRFSAAEVFWTLGAKSLAEKQTHEATLYLEKAAAFHPENAILLSEAAKVFLRDRNPYQALETVNRALTAGFSFDDLFLRQKILSQMGKTSETLCEWKRMATDYPGLFTPHIELGRMYLEQGELSKARNELETVLRIKQRGDTDRSYHAEAKRMLGQIRKMSRQGHSEDRTRKD